MVQELLFKILLYVVALDIIIGGVMIVLIINSRIILKKKFLDRRFEIKAIKAAKNAKSSEDASRQLKISTEEFQNFCRRRNILTPEVRKERRDEAERRKQEDIRRIMEEEAAWRAEQERAAEQRRKEKEEELKIRKQRLRKFGIS